VQIFTILELVVGSYIKLTDFSKFTPYHNFTFSSIRVVIGLCEHNSVNSVLTQNLLNNLKSMDILKKFQ
jgi:hypothetical protein